jgi:hypothetical protein
LIRVTAPPGFRFSDRQRIPLQVPISGVRVVDGVAPMLADEAEPPPGDRC